MAAMVVSAMAAAAVGVEATGGRACTADKPTNCRCAQRKPMDQTKPRKQTNSKPVARTINAEPNQTNMSESKPVKKEDNHGGRIALGGGNSGGSISGGTLNDRAGIGSSNGSSSGDRDVGGACGGDGGGDIVGGGESVGGCDDGVVAVADEVRSNAMV